MILQMLVDSVCSLALSWRVLTRLNEVHNTSEGIGVNGQTMRKPVVRAEFKSSEAM